MKIRTAQMETLEEAALQSFESIVLPKLSEQFPRSYRMLGDGGMKRVIRHGVRLARLDGQVTEDGVGRYIELMFILGSGFRADAQLPWAAQILYDDAIPPGPARIDALYAQAMEYADKVYGAGNQNVDTALKRMRHWGATPLLPTSGSREILRLLSAAYPEKCAYLGPDGLEDLLRRGDRRSVRHTLDTLTGKLFCCGLLLVLGDAFDQDPQYPWIGEALGPSTAAGQSATERLYETSVAHIDQWLSS